MRSLLLLCLTSLLWVSVHAQTPNVIEWDVNSLDTIGGLPVTLIGGPVLIDTDMGKAVEFDGVDDGLLIESNPMAGTNEFTIEVLFKPYPGGLEEQRFVHFQQDDSNRALIELRSTPSNDWFLDTFIKSGSASRALLAENFPHATNEWWVASLVYKDNVMTHYVNGVEELSDQMSFAEVSSGKTSLGVRQNLRSWYKGAIKTLKVTHKALTPAEFMTTSADTSTVSTGDFVAEIIPTSIYPNPVVNDATLSYSVLNKAAHVVVVVYDMHSKPIATLTEELQQPGDYSTVLNSSGIPSGLYYYTILIDDKINTGKFLVKH